MATIQMTKETGMNQPARNASGFTFHASRFTLSFALITACSTATQAEPSVSYFAHDQVAAAFAKGDVLVGSEAGTNYMVHASRRENAGQAEVHTLDTDIIYVLDGSATFVTGGNVLEPQTVQPNEIRGSSISQGKTFALSKGDVVIVPKGTPHWFRDVPGPFTYFVVKVR
jgi:quercetin dioxygenase-like cupin family protein